MLLAHPCKHVVLYLYYEQQDLYQSLILHQGVKTSVVCTATVNPLLLALRIPSQLALPDLVTGFQSLLLLSPGGRKGG